MHSRQALRGLAVLRVGAGIVQPLTDAEGVYVDNLGRKEIEKHLNRLGKQGREIIRLDVIENARRINIDGVAKRE